MNAKSLLIKGHFTEEDLKELTAIIRMIEQRNPTQLFLLAVLDAELSVLEGREMVERIFPKIEGDSPTFVTLRTMHVVCADGKVRKMTTELGDFTPDIEGPQILMMHGVVEMDGQSVKGEAWLRDDGHYYFSAH